MRLIITCVFPSEVSPKMLTVGDKFPDFAVKGVVSTNPQTAFRDFQVHRLDGGFPRSMIDQADNSTAQHMTGYFSIPSLSTAYLYMNVKAPGLGDKRVREAISLALGRRPVPTDLAMALSVASTCGIGCTRPKSIGRRVEQWADARRCEAFPKWESPSRVLRPRRRKCAVGGRIARPGDRPRSRAGIGEQRKTIMADEISKAAVVPEVEQREYEVLHSKSPVFYDEYGQKIGTAEETIDELASSRRPQHASTVPPMTRAEAYLLERGTQRRPTSRHTRFQ